MIAYITLGTNDLKKAAEYYDKLLDGLGAKRVYDYETFVAWGVTDGAPMFSVIKPYDGNTATVGNGVMIALHAPDHATVDMLHAKALALGGTDEGAPGVREGGYYSGYFRDLDGNKLNFFCA